MKKFIFIMYVLYWLFSIFSIIEETVKGLYLVGNRFNHTFTEKKAYYFV